MIQFKTKRGQLGLIRTNIAYVLVDAAHSLLMDAQDDFKSENLVMQKEVRGKLAAMKNAARDLKVRCRDFALDAYQVKNSTEVSNFCDDADFLAEFILTLVDRSGDSDELMKKLYHQVFNSKSVMNLL